MCFGGAKVRRASAKPSSMRSWHRPDSNPPQLAAQEPTNKTRDEGNLYQPDACRMGQRLPPSQDLSQLNTSCKSYHVFLMFLFMFFNFYWSPIISAPWCHRIQTDFADKVAVPSKTVTNSAFLSCFKVEPMALRCSEEHARIFAFRKFSNPVSLGNASVNYGPCSCVHLLCWQSKHEECNLSASDNPWACQAHRGWRHRTHSLVATKQTDACRECTEHENQICDSVKVR